MTTQVSPRREEILKALRDSRPLLDAFGVTRLSLFGSFARDEGREHSDVDLLVEFGRPIGLFEFVRLQRELGARLGRQVELVTPDALKPQLRDRILGEAVPLGEYVERHWLPDLTEAMDRVCTEVGDQGDAFVSDAGRQVLENTEW
jgi:uncharacterized protein